VLGQDGLVAEQADVALLGSADHGDRFDQRIFAALARVAAAAAHHHQGALFEQLRNQPDEESDQCAQNDDRDGAADGLRKGQGEDLVDEAAQRAAQEPAQRAVALTGGGTRRTPDSQTDGDTQHRPSHDAPAKPAVKQIKRCQVAA